MKSSIFNGEIDIKYILKKSSSNSDVLVVVFPGAFVNVGAASQLGYSYIYTLASFGVNALFVHTDHSKGYSSSRMTCINKDFIIERTVKALIDKCLDETGSTRVIVCGSSMGGGAAVYYGLKYDYDIISGACSFLIKGTTAVDIIAGGHSKEDIEWANAIWTENIKKAAERGYSKKIFLSWGKGEENYLAPGQGKRLLAELDAAGIQYTYKLYDYSNHYTVHNLFPGVLKQQLSLYLGLDVPDEENNENITADAALTHKVCDIYKVLAEKLDALHETTPNYDICETSLSGEEKEETCLRTFVYAVQGYHWLPKEKKAWYCGGADAFWGAIAVKNASYTLSFAHQESILNLFLMTGNRQALTYLEQNLRLYLHQREAVSRLIKGKVAFPVSEYQRRTRFFMRFATALNSKNMFPDSQFEECLSLEIVNSMEWLLKYEFIMPANAGHQWERLLNLLRTAQYFRNNAEFFDEVSKAAVEVAIALLSYYFDENGVCIFQQTRVQHGLAPWSQKIIDFMTENDFPTLPKTKRFIAMNRKVQDATAHLIRPDCVIPALGHSSYSSATTERTAGNFINLSSNLAILNDELAYITVNSGQNIHAAFKHCDLLSFTFWYDGKQIVYDSEGGAGILADYAASSVAHTALICDDLDYVTPDYFDWTTIDDAIEHEKYVLIKMSHMLIEGVTLKRALLWCKPNVIVLYDMAESENEHMYTQNYILPNISAETDDKSRVTLNIADDFTFTVSQYPVESVGDYELKQYTGTTDSGVSQEEMRGSQISEFKKLRKGLNLAYNKHAKKASFLTSIEAHSGKDTEVSVKALSVEGGVLKATLEDKNGDLLTIEERVDVEVVE